MRAYHLPTLMLALLIASFGPVWAGEPTEQLKVSVDRVVQILEDPSLNAESKMPERRAAIREVANTIFDFSETARRALGRHWQSLSGAAQAEFVALFTDLLERTYIGKLEQYNGEKLRYVGEATEGAGATVKTRLVTKGGAEVPVDYRMHRDGDRWRVYDIAVEGVSLVNNYRTQFNQIIQSASYEDLLKKLRARDQGFGGAAPPGKSPRS
jgi:phospholipid transport system substrate-binding protein